MKRIHVFIYGRVQGVNFRWNTKIVADRLNIKGWVRNLLDGRVEVVAEGEDEKINKFIEYLKKGPVLARVDKIEITEEKFKNEFDGFEVI
jgi:acylphosphatase